MSNFWGLFSTIPFFDMETKRDIEFRRNPDKAKAYAAKLQKRRANRETLNKLFDDSLHSSNH